MPALRLCLDRDLHRVVLCCEQDTYEIMDQDNAANNLGHHDKNTYDNDFTDGCVDTVDPWLFLWAEALALASSIALAEPPRHTLGMRVANAVNHGALLSHRL